MHPAHQPYVEEPKAVFPLSKADGALEVIYREFEGVENLVAYDTFWAPTGLIGSPLFDIDLDHESRITVELPGFNIKSFTIFMWIRPTFDEIQTSIMVTYFHFKICILTEIIFLNYDRKYTQLWMMFRARCH